MYLKELLCFSLLYNEALKITKLINDNSISDIIDEILYEFKSKQHESISST